MTDDNNVVTCANQNCRVEVARLVHADGASFLQVGGLLLREAHGICIQCGTPFHWSVRDMLFEKLVGRLLKV